MKIVPNTSVPPQIIELSPGTYLVSSPKTKCSIVCPDTSVTYLEQCNLCQIRVKCQCTLNVSHLKVTAPLDICHLTLPAIKIKHGINMALMNHFHLNSPQLTHGSSLSTHPIKFQIPNISQNIQKFKDLTDDQIHTALDLHKVIEAIKEERDTYNTINLTATETFLSKLPFSDNNAFFPPLSLHKYSIYITPSTTVDPFQSYYYVIAMLTVIGTIFAFIRFAHFCRGGKQRNENTVSSYAWLTEHGNTKCGLWNVNQMGCIGQNVHCYILVPCLIMLHNCLCTCAPLMLI